MNVDVSAATAVPSVPAVREIGRACYGIVYEGQSAVQILWQARPYFHGECRRQPGTSHSLSHQHWMADALTHAWRTARTTA